MGGERAGNGMLRRGMRGERAGNRILRRGMGGERAVNGCVAQGPARGRRPFGGAGFDFSTPCFQNSYRFPDASGHLTLCIQRRILSLYNLSRMLARSCRPQPAFLLVFSKSEVFFFPRHVPIPRPFSAHSPRYVPIPCPFPAQALWRAPRLAFLGSRPKRRREMGVGRDGAARQM